MHKLLKDIPLPKSHELFKVVAQHNRRYSEHVITEQARADAKLGIPLLESPDPAPFLERLKEERTIVMSKISTQYKAALEMLDARVKAEERYVADVHDQTRDAITSHSAVEEDLIVDNSMLKDARRQLELAEKRYHDMYEKVGRSPTTYIPHWLYWILATVIFLGEIPLNALVFEIFGENQIMTWVMAFVIGLSVPLSAHFIGIKFRERSEGWWGSNYLKGGVSLAVIVAALYGLSEIRTTYLSEFRDELGLTQTLVDSTTLFFWLNIAVLGAAVVISYLSHDPNPGYEVSKKEYLNARRRLEKLERARLKKLKQSRFRKLKSVKYADQDFRDGQNRVNYLKGYYDMLLKEGQELERQCLAGFRHDIALYRQENLRARDDKKQPKSFSLEFELPMNLHLMSEKLEN